jgi:hypothetical protein
MNRVWESGNGRLNVMTPSSPHFFCAPATHVGSKITNNSFEVTFTYYLFPHLDKMISGSKRGSAIRPEFVMIIITYTLFHGDTSIEVPNVRCLC